MGAKATMDAGPHFIPRPPQELNFIHSVDVDAKSQELDVTNDSCFLKVGSSPGVQCSLEPNGTD